MKLAGYYGILVRALIAAQWAFFLAAGLVPELVTEPIRISFHLAAELITALGLMVAGVGLLRQTRRAPYLYTFFAGMLTYSVVVSPGYFAQQGQWILVLMFAVLFLLALASVFTVGRQAAQGGGYVEA